MFCAHLLGIIFMDLILMTTLATFTNALAKEEPIVRHECGEKTLCHIKPAGYPQEEIDKMAFKYLRHLQRLKRQVEHVEPAAPEEGGNCGSVTLSSPVYTMRDSKMAPQYLVQSKWFTQEIPQIQCKNENSPCFTAVVIPGVVNNTSCKTNRVTTSLIVFDQTSKKPARVDSLIDTGCECPEVQNNPETGAPPSGAPSTLWQSWNWVPIAGYVIDYLCCRKLI